MSINNITFFEKDLNSIIEKKALLAESKLQSSNIEHDSNDDSLLAISEKILQDIWDIKELSIDSEPIEKNSFEQNLSFEAAMAILRTATVSGYNPATFANYSYGYEGTDEVLTSSPHGRRKYSFLGDKDYRKFTITIAVSGAITKDNVESVKRQRDQILNSIKEIVEANNRYLNEQKQILANQIRQKADGIRTTKMRIKNTNDLL